MLLLVRILLSMSLSSFFFPLYPFCIQHAYSFYNVNSPLLWFYQWYESPVEPVVLTVPTVPGNRQESIVHRLSPD